MKVFRIFLLRLGWVGLLAIGCQPVGFFDLAWSSPPAVSVAEISQRRGDRIISLKGRVIARVPFIDSGSYQIQDDTGTVWILTKNPLPNIGEEVTIKGQVEYQPIPIGGQDIGEFYVLELEKLATASASSTPMPAATTLAPPDRESPPAVQSPIQPDAAISPATRPDASSQAATPQPQQPEVPTASTDTPSKPPPTSQPGESSQPPTAKPTPEPKPVPLNIGDRYFPHKRNVK